MEANSDKGDAASRRGLIQALSSNASLSGER